MLTMAKCACTGCNVRDYVGNMVQVKKNNRGGANAYLCRYHAQSQRSYSTESEALYGIRKAHGFTYGGEFESMVDSPRARIELTSRGWIPTQDITVRVEYKTPIFEGLNALSKDCEVIDNFNLRGEFDTLHPSVGTHLNIGHHDFINRVTVDYIRRFCHSLFVPLTNAMRANSYGVEALFGRALDLGWANGYEQYTDPEEHTNFINLQHSNRIEFRICKFRSADQYMRAAKCATKMLDCIITNFIQHFNDDPKDKTRYATKTAYRKHKAEATAKKLVRIFEKFAAEAITNQ